MPRKTRRRLRAPLFVGVVIAVLVAGVGLAVAGVGEWDPPGAAGGSVDPTREAAVAYLMGGGVSERDARVRMSRQSAQIAVATRLRRQAPDDIRSVWIDDDGVLVASVVTDRGVALAEAAGAVPVLVTFAAAELEAARDTLIDDVMSSPPPGLSGASFEIDESAGKVIARYFFAEAPGVVPVASTELGDLAQATVETAQLGVTAEVGAGHTTLRNGDRNMCTTGWTVDVVDGPDPADRYQGVMTAGHCFRFREPPENTELSVETTFGDTVATGLAYAYGPVGDFGYLRLNSDDEVFGVAVTPDGEKFVRQLGDPVSGSTICKVGASTNETCGQIERVNISVVIMHDGESFLMRGMVRASYCAMGGDSGGPVYASYTGFGATDSSVIAIGLHSSSIRYPRLIDGPEGPDLELVCGEMVGQPNESYFQPLSNIDSQDRYFVKIFGG